MHCVIINICDSSWTWNIKSDHSRLNLIDSYIEDHADRLKLKYLSFIAHLVEFRIDNKKSIAEYLELKNGYSLWWMSLLAEKSLYKSPEIANCLNLLAIEEILVDLKATELIINGGDINVVKALSFLCSGLNIKCVIGKNRLKGISFRSLLNPHSLYLKLAYPLRSAFFFCCHLATLTKLKSLKDLAWFEGSNSILLFSYFIHLDHGKSDSGCFYSRQWEILPDLLKSFGIRTNWIHHFLKSDVAGNIDQGQKLISKFNSNSDVNGMHAFISSYSSLYLSWKVMVNYILINFKLPRRSIIEKAFKLPNSSISFWPLLKDDWLSSTRGPIAVQNLLWIFQMDKAMRLMPRQNLGLYLQENQGWERALLHAWKRHNHGDIIGIQHSSLRFWDLRYYDDVRILNDNNGVLSQPKPQFIALNGPQPFRFYLEAGYPKESFVFVEALRYLDGQSKNSGGKLETSRVGLIEDIIILGDILVESNKALLNILQEVQKNWRSLTLKSHPGAIININDYPDLTLQEEKRALSTILPGFGTAIAIGSTTAALDAYLAGLKVIVFLVNGELNLSPLRGFKDVYFVRSNQDLAIAIGLAEGYKDGNTAREKYFWTDRDLPRWRELLSHYYKN